MTDTVAVPLRALQKIFPETLKDMRIWIKEDQKGTLHRSDNTSCSTNKEQRMIPVLSLKQSSTCPTCLRAYYIDRIDANNFDSNLGNLFSEITELLKILKKIEKEKSDRNSQSILRSRKALQSSLNYISISSRKGLAEKDEDSLKKLLEKVEEDIQDLSSQLRSEKEQEAVLQKIKEELIGEVSGPILDDSKCLIGVHPYKKSNWTQVAQSLLEQNMLTTRPLVVLVPRYAVEYLLMQRDALRNGLQLSASAEGLSKAEQETAAKLWDPNSNGPLRTLMGCVQTAKAI